MSSASLDKCTVLSYSSPFRRLDEAALEAAAAQFEEISFQAGQNICRQGRSVDSFYVIAEGCVRLSRQGKGGRSQAGMLNPGDCLGIEGLTSRAWEKTATADGEVIVLRISLRKLQRLMALNPDIGANILIDQETRRLFQPAGLNFLQEGETVYFITRRHPFFLMTRLFLPVILGFACSIGFLFLALISRSATVAPYLALGAGLGLSVVWGLWNWLDWHNDYSVVTNQRLVWLERIVGFYDSRQEAPLGTVLSVDVRTSQLGRIIGYGDVVIRTYSGIVLFKAVGHPKQVAALVEDYWFRAKTSSRKMENEAMERAIRQRLGLTDSEVDEGGENRNILGAAQRRVKPGALPTWLSTFLHLRFEAGGVITYRKHWFILLRQTWKPVFWLLIGVGIAAARLFNLFTFLSVDAVLLVCGVYGLGIAGWLFYEYLDWRNDIFQVTQEQVLDVDRKPFGKEEKKSAPLENILSIQYQRLGLMGLIFNFGTVYITVGNIKLTFDYVFNPSQVQDDIYKKMAERSAWKKRVELEEQRERVSEWFASYAEIQKENGTPLEDDESPDYPDFDLF